MPLHCHSITAASPLFACGNANQLQLQQQWQCIVSSCWVHTRAGFPSACGNANAMQTQCKPAAAAVAVGCQQPPAKLNKQHTSSLLFCCLACSCPPHHSSKHAHTNTHVQHTQLHTHLHAQAAAAAHDVNPGCTQAPEGAAGLRGALHTKKLRHTHTCTAAHPSLCRDAHILP